VNFVSLLHSFFWSLEFNGDYYCFPCNSVMRMSCSGKSYMYLNLYGSVSVPGSVLQTYAFMNDLFMSALIHLTRQLKRDLNAWRSI